MQIYNLLECSSNYFDTTGSLSFYSQDKASSFNNDIANINNFNYNFYCIKLCTSPNFKLHEKAKLLRKTEANAVKYISRKATIAVSLKYVSNFWRSFEMPLINCKVELKLKWTYHCVCLHFVLIIMILIIIMLFLLSKTQNYVSLYQQKTNKNYQNSIRINIKQRVRRVIQRMNVDILSKLTL